MHAPRSNEAERSVDPRDLVEPVLCSWQGCLDDAAADCAGLCAGHFECELAAQMSDARDRADDDYATAYRASR